MGYALKRRSKTQSIVEHVTHGSVFDDVGFSPKKAASVRLKAELHRKIVRRAEHYSQRELQSILAERQSRVSQLLHGKISGFTLDMLVHYAESLGIHTEIKTTESRKPFRLKRAAKAPGREKSSGSLVWTSKKSTRFKIAAIAR